MFKNDKYLMGVKEVRERIKINCNAGAVVMNMRGSYGILKVWYLPDSIANIFSMHKLEQLYRITYDSWDEFYVMHTPRGEVRFHKDKQGLPFINLNKSDKDAAILLVQLVEAQGEEKNNKEHTREGTALVQTVLGNYKGFTKREVLQAQEARQAQAMLGNLSKKDFQGMVSGNLIPNCPITHQDISNAR